MENNLEEVLKKQVEIYVSDKIEEEIVKKVEQYYKELTYRKDDYIAEIMKGIRILHEKDPMNLGINYKIIFENKVELVKGE